jgi:hypothetical protein
MATLMKEDGEPPKQQSFGARNTKRTTRCREVAAMGGCLTDPSCDISCLTFPGMLAAFLEIASGVSIKHATLEIQNEFVHPQNGARMRTSTQAHATARDLSLFPYDFQFGLYSNREHNLHAKLERDTEKDQTAFPRRGYKMDWEDTIKRFIGRRYRHWVSDDPWIGTIAPATRAIAAACLGHTRARVEIRTAEGVMGIANSYTVLGLIPVLLDWFRSVVTETSTRSTFTVYGTVALDGYILDDDHENRVMLHVQPEGLRVATNEQILGPLWSDTKFAVPVNIDSAMKAKFASEGYKPPRKGTLYRLAPGMVNVEVVIHWDGTEKMSLVEWLGLRGRWFEG